jgi:hypothetical protein
VRSTAPSSTTPGRAPLLLHIGYHKTGTSWLQNRLFSRVAHGYLANDWQRADLHALFVKRDPLAFDAMEARHQLQDQLDRAAEAGLTFVLSHERFSGYFASGGYDAGLIADRLTRTFPEARCLICIREQRSMIAAVHRQYLEDGGYLSLRRFLHPPDPERNFERVPGFRFEFYEYDRLIRHWQAALGPERVLVLPFELLRRDGQAFVDRISDFCGTPPYDYRHERSINPRRTHLYFMIKRLVNLFLTRNQLCDLSPINVPYLREGFILLAPTIDLFCPGPVNRLLDRRLARAVAREVGSRYGASNRETSRLIGIDLSDFGYEAEATSHGVGEPLPVGQREAVGRPYQRTSKST